MKAVLREIAEAERPASSCSSTSCTPSSAPGRPKAPRTPANMLKPALARGELHCVGATTLDEYRKHVEKDAALERRFQPVFVGEPSVEDTVSILRGLKERYEVHHGVRIHRPGPGRRRPALRNRYITDRLPPRQGDRPGRRGRQPRARADRLDARGARRSSSARCTQLEIEREALKKEDDDASVANGSRSSSSEIAESARARNGRAQGALAEREGADCSAFAS